MSDSVKDTESTEHPAETAQTDANGDAGSPDGVGVVEPARVRVWEDAFHRFHVSLDGEEFTDVRAVRTFPVSGKADYVSFLDEGGKEVVLLKHPHKLDKASRAALHKAFEKMYYVPVITCVYSITEKMGVTNWQVMTDRGYASFEVVGREHIRRLPERRFLITDADGNRFEIKDVLELDERSQTLIRSET